MPYYLLQVSYTSKGLATLVKNPQNRMDALRPVFVGLGGRLDGMWFSFGDYDLVMICQMPDNVSVAAISMAISSGDAVKTVKTTPLMTMKEGMEAMKKATTTPYHPPSSMH
jgi:uncharacterized protein with GYD domain